MNGSEFKCALRRLGRTQAGFALEIGASRRGVHHWAEKGPPPAVVYLLALIETYGVAADQMDAGPGAMLDAMMSRTTDARHRTDFVQAVELWLMANRPA